MEVIWKVLFRPVPLPTFSTPSNSRHFMKSDFIARDFGHQGFVTSVGFTHGRAIVTQLQSTQSRVVEISLSGQMRTEWKIFFAGRGGGMTDRMSQSMQ